MIDLVEIAWIAGLLEGEGSFLNVSGRGLEIHVQMTDKDIVERAARTLGSNRLYEYQPNGNRKHVYSTRVSGYRAAAWMLTVYSFMGERRKEAIHQTIIEWKKSPNNPRGMRGEKLPEIYSTCHPKRPRYFKMLCRQCCNQMYYDRAGRKKKRKRLQSLRCVGTSDLFQ